MIAAMLQGAALTEAVVAANAAGSEAAGRLGAVGEVEVAAMALADPMQDPMFPRRAAAPGGGEGSNGP